jgi:hypothetical protein
LIKKSDYIRNVGMKWALVPLHPFLVGCKTHN